MIYRGELKSIVFVQFELNGQITNAQLGTNQINNRWIIPSSNKSCRNPPEINLGPLPQLFFRIVFIIFGALTPYRLGDSTNRL